jgi:hypothetical protein
MPSTYSNLKIQLMATGENNTTWGNVTNVNLGTALEEAIVGSADVAFSNADVTLTLTDTNSTQSARNMRLNLTGTATAGYNLVVPAIEKPYIVNNGTDGTITVKNTTGTGIAVPAGKTMWVYNNGTNVVGVVTHLSSVTLGSALPVTSGGTGVNTLTSGYLVKGNGTSAVSASIVYDDGTNVGINGVPSAWGGSAKYVQLAGVGFWGSSSVGKSAQLGVNAYFDGSAWKYTTAGYASYYAQSTGRHQWLTSASGSAGATVTFTTAMTLDASGNLGIGTSSPTAKLEVIGNANFGAAIVTGSGVSTGDAQFELGGNRSGDGPAYMDFHAVAGGDFNARVFRGSGANGNMEIVNAGTGVLSIATNATEKMRIEAGGNVGIGTVSPATLLSVNGSATANENFFSVTGGVWFNAANVFTRGIAQAGSDVALYTSGTEKMRIDSAGNVMVGTTSATGLFSVNGVSYGQMIATDRFGVFGNNLYFGGGGGGNFRYIGNGHAYGWTQGNTDGADLRLLYAGNNTSGAGAVATTSERIYITSSGFVGVGTSTDNGVDKLTVAGIVGSYVSGRAGFHLYNGGATAEWFIGQPSASSHNLTFSKLVSGTYTDYVAINSSGNVGIGTTSPAVSLDVVGGIRARGGVPGALGVNNNGYAFNTPGDNDTGMFSSADGQLEFYSNNGEVIRISSAGLVGINNTSPTVTLDVTGGIKTSRTAVTSPATSDGNIFSGTYTPTLTNVANIDIPASTAYTFQYMRVGNVVTVSGKIDVTVTGTGLTRLNVSLPISSNFSAEENCAGTAVMTASSVSINIPATIRADTTNDVAEMRYWGNLTGMAQAYFLTFTYRII